MTSDERAGGDRPPRATGETGVQANKLSDLRPLTHDEDERPSREDRDYGSTIFTRPTVPVPRFLRGGKKKKRP
jgi:hypothetical protein